jgi:hypothetical protein
MNTGMMRNQESQGWNLSLGQFEQCMDCLGFKDECIKFKSGVKGQLLGFGLGLKSLEVRAPSSVF